VKLVVAGFKEDGSVGRRKNGVVEEVAGFFCVASGGLLEEDVFSCLQGFERPFVVEAVGEGVVDAVDGWVGDEV
jgi:hypothetical protein